MKKYRYTLLAFITCFFNLNSCKQDFFELERPPEFPWQNVEEFERAAIGAYNAVFTASSWGNTVGSDAAVDFTLSDCSRFVWGSQHGYPSDDINKRNFSKNHLRLDGAWENIYRSIGVANSALELIQMADGNPFPLASQDDKEYNIKRIEGELRFIRAYDYFYLVRWFHPPYNPGGDNSFRAIMFREKFPRGIDEALELTQKSTEEIYKFLVEEFTKAKEMLPVKHISGKMHPSYKYGRANKFVASAFLMRVYIVLNKWAEAKAEADYIISQGGYELDDDYMKLFARSWDNYQEEAKGLIWEIFAANQGNPPSTYSPSEFSHFTKMNMFGQVKDEYFGRYAINDNGEWIMTEDGDMVAGNFIFGGWPQYSMSHKVLQEKLGWYTADYRLTEKAMKDKRVGNATHNVNSIYYYIGEYKPLPSTEEEPDAIKRQVHNSLHITSAWMEQENRPTLWVDKYWRGREARKHNTTIVRLAEIYLTRAIVRLKTGDKQGAADDINKIRKRAWLPADVSFENSDQFVTADNITEDMIHNERIAELTGEGVWLWYLQAMRLPIDKGDHRNLGRIMKTPYTDMYFPIPDTEVRFFQGDDR